MYFTSAIARGIFRLYFGDASFSLTYQRMLLDVYHYQYSTFDRFVFRIILLLLKYGFFTIFFWFTTFCVFFGYVITEYVMGQYSGMESIVVLTVWFSIFTGWYLLFSKRDE